MEKKQNVKLAVRDQQVYVNTGLKVYAKWNESGSWRTGHSLA